MRVDDRRHDVLAEIVRTFGDGGVAAELIEQEVGVEDVNPHRRQTAILIIRHRLGIGRLLEEFLHPVRLVDLHHTELRTLFQLDRNAADRAIGPVRNMVLHDLRIIHLVDVIAGEDQDVIGTRFLDRIDVLVDRVGCPLVPVLIDSLLRGQNVDELIEFAAQKPPAQVQMPIKTGRLVLRQHQHAAQAAVDAIGESEIDDAVDSPEGDRRFGTIPRQRFQASPFSARQDQGHHSLHPPLPPEIVAGTFSWVSMLIYTRTFAQAGAILQRDAL
jgi:hypothetical protein